MEKLKEKTKEKMYKNKRIGQIVKEEGQNRTVEARSMLSRLKKNNLPLRIIYMTSV